MDFRLSLKNISKNIGREINKSLSSKCSQKLLDHTKHSARDTLTTASCFKKGN